MVLGKAFRFALVGVVNASVDFGVYSLMRFYFGLPLIVANLVSWTIAVSGSYVMNSKFTFAAESGANLSIPLRGVRGLADRRPRRQHGDGLRPVVCDA